MTKDEMILLHASLTLPESQHGAFRVRLTQQKPLIINHKTIMADKDEQDLAQWAFQKMMTHSKVFNGQTKEYSML